MRWLDGEQSVTKPRDLRAILEEQRKDPRQCPLSAKVLWHVCALPENMQSSY